MTQEVITIGIICEQALLRNGIVNLLHDNGFCVVIQSGDGANFMQQLEYREIPSIVLIELDLPGVHVINDYGHTSSRSWNENTGNVK